MADCIVSIIQIKVNVVPEVSTETTGNYLLEVGVWIHMSPALLPLMP